ncbi:methyltransferase family protein [Idiomarina xiamenensis]|uniref:Isoprenylcysteine carboxylmethyltransferase family protein n=1 Tax=Idiomarina xiamenensis 10-D-4 TaxID=740709 RepID=K2L1L5_9GAMM|nr:isoprenylcysteine carboxylmethyltransferase family protein [Idiomarina xiamenensis]EKE83670.1 putative protein-S-isoprenylcysteine methyltransferase [Idiomarina xiamenensis 10-D-4]
MFDFDLFVRTFLGLYFLLIGIQYTSTGLGIYQRTGESAISYGDKGSATWWVRQVFNGFRAAILVVCIGRIFWPIDAYLGVFDALYQPAVLGAGITLLLVSFARISYVHAFMRQHWRSGIGSHSKTAPELLTHGPFSRSRNPMFIAIMIGQLGLFLALPSVFTLLCLMVGAAMIVFQASHEEHDLNGRFGDSYRQYQQQVKRWL